MTEIQAVIGRIHLGCMPDWLARNLTNAEMILEACLLCDWLRGPSDSTSAESRAYVFVKPELLPEGWERDTVLEEFIRLNTPVFQGFRSEVCLEKAFNGAAWRPTEPLPVAKSLGALSLVFLVHSSLTPTEIDQMWNTVRTIDDNVCDLLHSQNYASWTFNSYLKKSWWFVAHAQRQ